MYTYLVSFRGCFDQKRRWCGELNNVKWKYRTSHLYIEGLLHWNNGSIRCVWFVGWEQLICSCGVEETDQQLCLHEIWWSDSCVSDRKQGRLLCHYSFHRIHVSSPLNLVYMCFSNRRVINAMWPEKLALMQCQYVQISAYS